MTSGRWVVTGGLGFMGSALIRNLCASGIEVLNIDADTYAGDVRRLAPVQRSVRTEITDILDPAISNMIEGFQPDVVAHLAAETHVTRSELDAERFYRTNVDGTKSIFEAAVRAGATKVVHVSTDEVYGSFEDRPFLESDKEPGEGNATSAYARSKALADDLAFTFCDRVPVVVVRPANCFGPYQHPEKAIPRWAIRAVTGQRLPVWGDGLYVRDWMYVDDAAIGLTLLAERGASGEAYNLAPEGEPLPNAEIARTIAASAGRDSDAVYLTEYDRPGHDRRYAIEATKVRSLGWEPSADLRTRLSETVEWYSRNESWWKPLVEEAEGLYEDRTERGVSAR